MVFSSRLLLLFLICGCQHLDPKEKVTCVQESRSPNSASLCHDLFRENALSIPNEQFEGFREKAGKTIKTSNPATVKRSEWKAWSSRKEVIDFLKSLTKDFGGSFQVHSKGSLIDQIRGSFERTLIDGLRTRDPGKSSAARDYTATYYTKKILTTSGGRAKHQFRVRSYLMKVNPFEMSIGEPVVGFLNGRHIEIYRLAKNRFQVVEHYMQGSFKGELVAEHQLSGAQVQSGYNVIYPLHGRYLKLEMKSRLDENIETPQSLAKLSGQNYVEKPSMNLRIEDFLLLFSSQKNFLKNLEALKEEYQSRDSQVPNSKETVETFFNILKEIYQVDPQFFQFEGATVYKRLALVVPNIGVYRGKDLEAQITVDSAIAMHRVFGSQGQLLSPIEFFKKHNKMKSLDHYHVEVKVPQVLVRQLDSIDPASRLGRVLIPFNKLNIVNRGKFRPMRKRN